MVPLQFLPLKNEQGNDGEDSNGNHLGRNLELKQIERTAVALESHFVGRNEEAVFKQGNSPREQDDAEQGPGVQKTALFKLQMSIPGKCHEDVADNQQHNG